jgi:integrase
MAHVEKRGLGRWRARYRGPDGRERSQTFDGKVDAERWLAQVETDKARGQWVDPAAGRIAFEAWFAEWMATTTDLRPNTRALYEYLGRRYLLPGFGSKELAKVTAIDIRRWLAGMRGTKLSKNTVAKAYRLLSHVMTTAADEGLIGRSPCVIKGAGTEHLPEMQFATVDQVAEVADAVGPRYRALVLLAAFGGLRWGELGGLRRRRVDLLHRTVTVAEILTEVNGRLDIGPPKTEAGRRTVVLSAFLLDELASHLEQRGAPGPEGLVFPAPEGGPMRRSNFRRRTWEPATRTVGVPGLRFHDLRHSAGTLSAVAGATTKELMARMGHSSPRAALIYQHATAERDGAIADALDRLVAGTLAASSRPEPPLPLRPADEASS